jgi:hypothetical protein
MCSEVKAALLPAVVKTNRVNRGGKMDPIEIDEDSTMGREASG